jgi:hypothetical protein
MLEDDKKITPGAPLLKLEEKGIILFLNFFKYFIKLKNFVRK